MAQTYTAQWFDVSNGEITTHDPQSLAPTSKDIRILSAEVQWEGVETTSSSTDYSTNSNSDSRSVSGYSDGFSEAFQLTFPSVPNGYSFFNHAISANISTNGNVAGLHYTFEINSNQVLDTDGDESGETYSTRSESVGADVTVIISADSVDDASFVDLSAEASTTGSTSTTTTHYTQDPRATRDVLGESGGVTLSDGEQSSWFTLNDLALDPEEFYHDIDGSGEARFRFRFDWEESYPDALKQTRIYDAEADAVRKVALADPSDSQLDYSVVRVAVGGTVYALDIVLPSDPDAITSHRIQHPTHGTLCPRAYDTV